MAHDQARIREFARGYTDAWCSHDPTRVADHFRKVRVLLNHFKSQSGGGGPK